MSDENFDFPFITEEILKQVRYNAHTLWNQMAIGREGDMFMARVYFNASLSALLNLGYKITLRKENEVPIILSPGEKSE